MALIKFGAVVVDASGKSNGHVFSKNRGGSYLRTKVTPTNPRSSDQIAARAKVSTYAQGWRGLTDAQRTAWNAAVADFKRTNIFGDMKSPSGINLYVRINTNIALAGGTAISTPPLPSSVPGITTLSATAAHGTPAVSLTFSPAITSGHEMIVRATPAMSPGKSFVKSALRICAKLTSTDSSPKDILSLYTAKFGSVGAAGQKIHFEAYVIDSTNGLVGAKASCDCTIGA